MTSRLFTTFEYLYRDAGNFKTWGTILLEGSVGSADEEVLRRSFIDGVFFDPTSLGIPSLRESLWAATGSHYLQHLDHQWHELVEMREASDEEVSSLTLWGSLEELIQSVGTLAKSDHSV
ncbi:MAG: hypothetical protein LPJ87_03230 [Zoogloeaceae bacterium]|nr:hypothetical protein [Zoogloeaceae bacterium]